MSAARRRAPRCDARPAAGGISGPLAALTAAVLALLAAAGCGGADERADPASGGSSSYAGWIHRLDRAEERGVADGDLLARAAEHPEPAVRRAAARAIAVLAPPDAVALLAPRCAASEPEEVRTASIRSLGLLKRAEALPVLAGLLAADPDPSIRRHAAVALGRLAGEGVPSDAVGALLPALADADAGVRGGAALAIWRHGESAATAIGALAALLDDPDDEVRWRAAYALMRIRDPATLPPLRARLSDPHRWVRTFAAWGMREPVDPEAVEPLGALLADDRSPWTARVQALRSLGAIRGAQPGSAEGSESAGLAERARDILIEHLLREEHPGAIEALLEALAVGGGEIEAPFIVATIERAATPTARRAAVRALGRIRVPDVLPRLEALSRDENPWLRAAVADALGAVGAAGGPLLTALLRDEDARVRAAAAQAIGVIDAPFRWPLLETVLGDPDLAVRATAVEAIVAGKPDRWRQTLEDVWRSSREPEHWELRTAVIKALGADGAAVAPELADEGLRDPFLTVRLAAASVLGRAPPGPDEAPPPRGLPFPRIDDPFAPDENPIATIETDRGALVIELALDAAPRHVAGFIALAERGAYDGLGFHRVVPSFVVQGGDPRGDGWGDSGYHLVDELNSMEFARGTVGMPKAGDHTGGSQIFITHLPTPHLDGRYTVFGQVIEGLDVLDRLEVGDEIRSVTIRRTGARRGEF